MYHCEPLYLCVLSEGYVNGGLEAVVDADIGQDLIAVLPQALLITAP